MYWGLDTFYGLIRIASWTPPSPSGVFDKCLWHLNGGLRRLARPAQNRLLEKNYDVLVDVHLVRRRASELDEGGQRGGLAAAGHAAVNDRGAGPQTLVEERRHVLVQSELVHLCAQEDEVVGHGRVDREDDGAAHVEPRVVADAANAIVQLELLAARGQVAGRGALGGDNLESRVTHCEAGREGGCESRDPARPPVQSAQHPKPGGSGAHCQAAADDAGGCTRSRRWNRTFSEWRGFALRGGDRIGTEDERAFAK